MSTAPEEYELWIRYRQFGDNQARDFLFLKYTSWARAVAASVYRRLRVSQVEWADYVQNAQIGLLEAMSRFDVARGYDFMAYAKPRVRGAVFNGLRSALKEDEHRRGHEDDRKERLQSLNEQPSSDPLLDFIGSVIGLGLGHLLETEQFDAGSDHAHGLVERHELGLILRDALLDLKDRERRILIAHYFRQVPFQEIAKEYGITKGRVSQIHKAALMQLRALLGARRVEYQSL